MTTTFRNDLDPLDEWPGDQVSPVLDLSPWATSADIGVDAVAYDPTGNRSDRVRPSTAYSNGSSTLRYGGGCRAWRQPRGCGVLAAAADWQRGSCW